MFQHLSLLKDKGYTPDTILDIGAYHGHWTHNMLSIYPNAQYLLFEAIDYKELEYYNDARNIQQFHVLLYSREAEVDWYEQRNTGDSIFRERTRYFKDCVAVKREAITLNSFIRKEKLLIDSKHILIKIDCQGAEIPILQGATDVLCKTDFIVLEMPFFGSYNEGVPTFLEHIQFMNDIGFIPYDVLEHHYINGFNMQIDMLFINKNHPFNTAVF
jgi:FkbM family methyltransferase